MAVIKIWDIKDSLRRLLVYITNHNKTKNENYTDDPSAMPYFISGINCDSDMAYEEMMITKQQYQKSGGILAFHAVQSFQPGEITPELAHQLGVEYAKEMWGDRFEIIVTTHINTNHIHNHFVINSVSFVDCGNAACISLDVIPISPALYWISAINLFLAQIAKFLIAVLFIQTPICPLLRAY